MSKFPRSFRVWRGYVHGLILLAFLGLAAKLAWIQIYRHTEYAAKVARIERATIPLPARRGMIVDCSGRGLAVTTPCPSVGINPRAVPAAQREEVAAKLSKLLSLDLELVRGRLDRPLYFIWLKRQVTEEIATAVREADLPGVEIRQETARRYPNDTMLCHVLGFVDIEGNGLEGLEARYDDLLRGKPGEEKIARDGLGRRLGSADGRLTPAVDGESLVLTIDMRIQQIAEKELAAACAEHKPERAAVVIMDPWRGDVLAMANWPVFSPARFNEAPEDHRRIFALTDCLEPGSTFKPFVAATALAWGLVTPETKFDCHQGVWRAPGRTLHDAHGYGVLSVREIIAYSSNIGMAQIGMRLTPERMYSALRAFGFGTPTGIELPGETSGLLHVPSDWSKLTITSLPMGQEVAVSPLQLAAGFCVFANGGWYVPPRIIRGVADTTGRKMLREMSRPPARQVLDESIANLMGKELLAGVVEFGTARACAVDGYTMAGKTGTAQIARTDGRGYEPGAYTAAFAAIAPVENPSIVIVAMVKKPTGRSHYGGVVAAPAVSRMVEQILSLKRIQREASVPQRNSVALQGHGRDARASDN